MSVQRTMVVVALVPSAKTQWAASLAPRPVHLDLLAMETVV